MAASCSWRFELLLLLLLLRYHINILIGDSRVLVSTRFESPSSRGPFKSMFVICISHAFELTALCRAHFTVNYCDRIGQPATAATLLQQQHHCCSGISSSSSNNGKCNASAFSISPFH